MSPEQVARATPDYNREVEKQPRPYVRFELRPQEFRDDAGKVGYRDVAWAIVQASGSKDTIEKPAEEWIKGLDMQVAMGRCPRTWPRDYQEALKDFMRTEEMPVMGTPIKTWSGLTPAQRKAVISSNIVTVEDLAVCNEEAIQRIGMGGRNLKEIAVAYLADRDGPGGLARKLDTVMVQLAEVITQNKELRDANNAMKMLLPQPESRNAVNTSSEIVLEE